MRRGCFGFIAVELVFGCLLLTTGCNPAEPTLRLGIQGQSVHQTVTTSQDEDTACMLLVLSAMLAIESARLDLGTFDPGAMTPDVLRRYDPGIGFLVSDGNTAATAPMAQARAGKVDYYGSENSYAVGSCSESGRTFGVVVDGAGVGSDTFYVNGLVADWNSLEGMTTAGPDTTVQRQSVDQTATTSQAEDAACIALVRSAVAAIESAYVDLGTFDPTVMTPVLLNQIEPSIGFQAAASFSAAYATHMVSAADNEVEYFGNQWAYAVGTLSQSGRTFGVMINKSPVSRGDVFFVDGCTGDW